MIGGWDCADNENVRKSCFPHVSIDSNVRPLSDSFGCFVSPATFRTFLPRKVSSSSRKIASDGPSISTSLPCLLLDEQHRRGIEGEGQLRDIRIVVIFQERKLHCTAVVHHLDDDRDRGGELRDRFGNAVLIRRDAAVRYGGHPHLDVELPGELPERLHLRQRRPLEVKTLEDQAGRIELGILFQKINRVAQLVDRERLAGISVDHTVALHLEPLDGNVLEMGGMGEVHEDLVVKLSYVTDGLVERDVQGLSPAHGIVKSDPDEERGFADAMAGDDDTDVLGTKSAVDRVIE